MARGPIEAILLRVDLADDPTVIALAAELEVDEDTCVGRLHRLWSWVSRHTDDGIAHGVSIQWIDRYLRHEGFALALERAGWLVRLDGAVQFPRWGKYGADVEPSHSPRPDEQEAPPPRRRTSTERVQRHRDRQRRRETPDETPETRFETPGETPGETPETRFVAFHETPSSGRSSGIRNRDPGSVDSERTRNPEPESGPDACARAPSVFGAVTVEVLRQPRALRDWFAAAVAAPRPVVRDCDGDYLFVVAAAEHVLGTAAIREPARLWASIVGRRRQELITAEDEERARNRIRTCPRVVRAVRSDPDVVRAAQALGADRTRGPVRSRDEQLAALRDRATRPP